MADSEKILLLQHYSPKRWVQDILFLLHLQRIQVLARCRFYISELLNKNKSIYLSWLQVSGKLLTVLPSQVQDRMHWQQKPRQYFHQMENITSSTDKKCGLPMQDLLMYSPYLLRLMEISSPDLL